MYIIAVQTQGFKSSRTWENLSNDIAGVDTVIFVPGLYFDFIVSVSNLNRCQDLHKDPLNHKDPPNHLNKFLFFRGQNLGCFIDFKQVKK